MTALQVTARATRDGDGFWLVHVPEIDCCTQARTRVEIEAMARDLVAVMRGLDPEQVTVTVELDSDDDRWRERPGEPQGLLGEPEVLTPVPAEECERDDARGLVARPAVWSDADRQRLAEDIAAAKADHAAKIERTAGIGQAAGLEPVAVARQQQPSVEVLVDRLVAAEATLEEVAAEFSRRDWSMPSMSFEQLMRGDEEPPRANYWEPIEVARQLGDITDAQYRTLERARRDAGASP